MPKRYGREFRRTICERLVAGERVALLSEETGVSPATLYLWKRQALIDAGLKPGIRSVEVDELAQAHRTIEELEAELEAVKAASALFNGEEPVSPKDGARLPKA
jgi:transposase-like protein